MATVLLVIASWDWLTTDITGGIAELVGSLMIFLFCVIWDCLAVLNILD